MKQLTLTSSQTVGPFFAPALLRADARRNVLTRPETVGERMLIEGVSWTETGCRSPMAG